MKKVSIFRKFDLNSDGNKKMNEAIAFEYAQKILKLDIITLKLENGIKNQQLTTTVVFFKLRESSNFGPYLAKSSRIPRGFDF